MCLAHSGSIHEAWCDEVKRGELIEGPYEGEIFSSHGASTPYYTLRKVRCRSAARVGEHGEGLLGDEGCDCMHEVLLAGSAQSGINMSWRYKFVDDGEVFEMRIKDGLGGRYVRPRWRKKRGSWSVV